MKKRKFVSMTNSEWFEKHFGTKNPNELSAPTHCPKYYGLEQLDCAPYNCLYSKCWNLPAKRNGRYILKEVKTK